MKNGSTWFTVGWPQLRYLYVYWDTWVGAFKWTRHRKRSLFMYGPSTWLASSLDLLFGSWQEHSYWGVTYETFAEGGRYTVTYGWAWIVTGEKWIFSWHARIRGMRSVCSRYLIFCWLLTLHRGRVSLTNWEISGSNRSIDCRLRNRGYIVVLTG